MSEELKIHFVAYCR